jgi:hypothetical protein
MQDKRKSRILSSWPKPPSEAPQISYPRKIRQTKEKTKEKENARLNSPQKERSGARAAAYSYRLPISVSARNSRIASVSRSSWNKVTTFSRRPLPLFLPVIFSIFFRSASSSRFQALHPPKRWPRVCFLPDRHHQQVSSSFFLIRDRWVPISACPEASWRKTAARRFGIVLRALRIPHFAFGLYDRLAASCCCIHSLVSRDWASVAWRLTR